MWSESIIAKFQVKLIYSHVVSAKIEKLFKINKKNIYITEREHINELYTLLFINLYKMSWKL